MAALGLALSLIAGIVAGVLLAGATGTAVWTVTAVGLLVTWTVSIIFARSWTKWLCAGLLIAGLGLLRGWVASHEIAIPTVVIPRGLIAARVLGASVPGPRCRLRVEVAGERWLLDSDAETCPRSAGSRVWLMASDIARADANLLPWYEDTVDPRSGSSRRVFVDALWVAPGSQAGGYFAWVAGLRQRAWQSTRGDPAGSLVVAAALGMPQALPPERRAQVRGAGLGHLLAVSGLHVALGGFFICGLISRLFAAFGRSRPEIGLLGLLPVVAYVLLTGGAPSAIRAGVMLCFVVVAAAVGRPSHGPTVLVLTAAGLLVVWPLWALDVGFQMSLAAMAVLVHPRAPRGLIAQSWRVTWATLPVALWHFGSGSLLGVVANLLALPVFCTWVLPLGIVGVLALGSFGAAALVPAAWGAQLILDLGELLARAPKISTPLLGAVALGLLILNLRRRSSLLQRRLPGWRPPTLGLAAVLVIVLVRAAPTEAIASPIPSSSWWAFGGGRRLEVIAPAIAKTGERVGICISGSWLSPGAFLRLYEHLGRPPVVELRDPRAAPEAALRRRLLKDLGALAVPVQGEHIECQWPASSDRQL
ncbi:MAG TPA: ComEC/Rec2 family competence protein, partial [Nannocystis exedens]|nr:ComEC/Rec2 family competence protein [Nannocystis exedens]